MARFSIGSALLLAAILVTPRADAQTNWTGTNGFSWNDSGNWSAGLPTSTALANFSNTAAGNITLDGNQQALGLAFTSTTPYIFDTGTGTNTLTVFGSGITASAASVVTINPQVVLGASQSWTLTAAGGSLTVNDVNLGTFALTIGATNVGTISINGVISGGLAAGSDSLIMSGGVLNLAGANTFTGNLRINGGTVNLSGGTNRLPTAATVTFNGTAGILNIGSTSQTLTNVAINTVLGSGTTGTINGTGGTLTLTGSPFQVGPAGAVTANTVHTLNMQGLSNFVYNNSAGTVRVGLASGATNTGNIGQVATLNLSANNTITAATVAVSDVGASNDPGIASVNLGTANAFNITTFNIGTGGRSDANVQFQTGLTNPTVTIRGLTGGSTSATTLNLGTVATFSGATQVTFASTADFSLGTLNANITTLNLGNASGGTATTRVGVSNATFTIGAGTLTAATLNLGLISGTGSTGATTFAGNGTFNLGTATAAGTLNVTTVNFTTNTITATGASTRTVSGVLNLNNGTLRATALQQGTQTGNATVSSARINWAGGTIENTTGSNLTIPNVGIFMATGTPVRSFNATGSNTITQGATAVLSGTGFGFSKDGTGTLIFNAANTYTGTTTVNAGTLQLATSGTLGGTSAPLALTGGTLDLNGINATVGAFSGTGGTVTNANAGTPAILTVGTGTLNTSALSFAGTLTNSGAALSLVKNGAGSLNFTGTATYTGATTVNTGSLQFTTAYPSASALTVAGGAAFSLVNGAATALNLPGLSLGTGSGLTALGLDLAAPGTNDSLATALAATAANTIRFDITALTGFGAGPYTLLTAASGLDTATYTIGSLPLGYVGSLVVLPSSVTLNVAAITPTNGPIYYAATASTSWAATALSGESQTFSSDPAGNTPAVGTPNSSNVVNFSSTAATVGTGTINSNLDGNYTIDSLVFNAAAVGVTAYGIAPGNSMTNTLTITPASSANGINVQAGAPASVTISAPLNVGATQTWTVADAATVLTISGTPTGTAAVTKAGAGTVRFLDTGFAAFSSPITISNGNLTFEVTTGTQTFPNILSGTGTVTKAGAGTLVLTGASTFSGGTTIAGGTLNVNSATALGTGSLTINAGGTFGNSSGGTVTLTNNNPMVWNGDFTKSGNSIDAGTGGVTLTANVNVNTGNATTFTIGGVIAGSGFGLTKSGVAGSILTLNGLNTYSGSTTTTVGTLNVSTLALNGTPSGLGTGTDLSIGAATVSYIGTANAVTDRTITLTGGAAVITLPSTGIDQTVEFSGNIGGTGALTKNEPGTTTAANSASSNLILSGTNNTFTGNVTITTGTLTIRNSASLGTGTKTVTINAGSAGAPSLRFDPGIGNTISLPSTFTYATSYNGTNVSNPNGLGSFDVRSGTAIIPGTLNLTSGGGSTAVYVAAGATIDLQANAQATSGDTRSLELRGDGTGTLSGVLANGTGANILGIVRNTGNAANTTAVWTITGLSNTYTGATQVVAGTLLVNGQTGTQSGTGASTVTVSGTSAAASTSPGVFGGNGRVGGPVIVNGPTSTGTLGGTLRPGNAAGVGTLELGGNLTVNANARLSFRITDATTPASADTGGSSVGSGAAYSSNNFLNITGGTTTLNSGMVIVVDGANTTFTEGQSYSYLVGQGAGVQNLTINNPAQFVLLNGLANAQPSQFTFTANSSGNMYVNFTYQVVPEPGAVLGLGLVGWAAARMLRRRLR